MTHIDQLNWTFLRRIHIWGEMVGVLTMFGGIAVVFKGFSISLIAPFPGIITIYLGYLLYISGEKAKRLNMNTDKIHQRDNMEELLKSYSVYLLISCVIAIIVILFMLFFYLFFN